MAIYSSSVVATSNGTANTEDVFQEIAAATGKEFKLKRIVAQYRGDATAAGAYNVEVRIIKVTAVGSGGATGTINAVRPTMPAAVSANNVKNGTSGFALGSSVVQLRAYTFQESGSGLDITFGDDAIYSGASGILQIVLKSSVVSHVYSVDCVFEE